MVVLKRIYDAYETSDGYRVLVDRLWPRGVSKKDAHVDEWMKEIAPSDELRTWFAHDPGNWVEFQRRYKRELGTKRQLVEQLRKLAQEHKKVTLLYGARDTEHNQAVVLLQVIK